MLERYAARSYKILAAQRL